MELLAEKGFIENGIIPIPGETRELPQKDSVKGLGLLLGRADEPAEVIAAGDLAAGLGLIHKHELIRDDIAVVGCPLADLHQLGGGGELHLVIGRDADIGGGYTVIFRRHPLFLLPVERHLFSGIFQGVGKGGKQQAGAGGQQNNDHPGKGAVLAVLHKAYVRNAEVKSQIPG